MSPHESRWFGSKQVQVVPNTTNDLGISYDFRKLSMVSHVHLTQHTQHTQLSKPAYDLESWVKCTWSTWSCIPTSQLISVLSLSCRIRLLSDKAQEPADGQSKRNEKDVEPSLLRPPQRCSGLRHNGETYGWLRNPAPGKGWLKHVETLKMVG